MNQEYNPFRTAREAGYTSTAHTDAPSGNAWSTDGQTPAWARPYDTSARQTDTRSRYNARQERHAADAYARQGSASGGHSESRMVAAMLAIFLGAFGAHKFYMGATHAAWFMLLVTLLTGGVGGFIMSMIGIAEGITYMMLSDEQFERTYLSGGKLWF